MLFFRRKENEVVVRARKQVKNAVPALKAILESEIIYLDDLEPAEDTTYPSPRLVKVLKVASSAHLKLKMDGVAPDQVSLLRYLNPSSTNSQGFTALCIEAVREIAKESLGLEEFYFAKLKELYIYLLKRLDEM